LIRLQGLLQMLSLPLLFLQLGLPLLLLVPLLL
jgi:hypothetical protein